MNRRRLRNLTAVLRGLPGRRGALALAVLAAAETATGLYVHRDTVSPVHLEAIAHMAASLPEGVPVLAADGFLDPHLRRSVPRAARRESAALPCLAGVSAVAVVGYGRTWSPALDAALEGRPPPRLEGVEAVGPLRFGRYTFDTRLRTTFDLWDLSGVEAAVDGQPCRRRGTGFDCGAAGRLTPDVVEVGYTPRACLRLDVADGSSVRLAARVRGRRLHGHLGFFDFNGRLRSDAPVGLRISVNGAPAVRFTVTDAQGFRPFDLPLPKRARTEPVSLAVTLDVPVRGTFRPDGTYDPHEARPPCLDLRVLTGEGPAEGGGP